MLSGRIDREGNLIPGSVHREPSPLTPPSATPHAPLTTARRGTPNRPYAGSIQERGNTVKSARALAQREAALRSAASRAGVAAEHVRLAALRASALVITNDYQRPLDASRALMIALEFDWASFGTLIVNQRPEPDGRLVLVDGQHRLVGAQLAFEDDDVLLPCLVMHLQTVAEEAAVFVRVNNQHVKVTYHSLVKPRLASGDQTMTLLVGALHSLGLHASTHTGGRSTPQPGEVRAVATLERIYKQAGIHAVLDVLTVLRDAWGLESTGYSTQYLSAVYNLLARSHGTVRRDRLVAVLRYGREGTSGQKKYGADDVPFGPAGLLALSDDYLIRTKWATRADALCSAIISLYNYKRALDQQLDPWQVIEGSAQRATHQKRMATNYRLWLAEHYRLESR